MNGSTWQSDVLLAQQSFEQNRIDEAEAIATKLVAEHPKCAEAFQIIGLVQSRRHQVGAAIATLEHALRIRCDLIPAHSYLGLLYQSRGEPERAIQVFERGLLLDPANHHLRFNRALALLKLGRFDQGWIEYEWRWSAAAVPRPEIPLPRWDGSPLEGRSILIHSEQGFGDTLQFMRFLPRVQQMGATVWMAVQKPLTRLLCDIDGVDHWMPVDQPAPIAFDLYSPLLSLPALLQLDHPEQFRVPTPYLHPEPKRVEAWRGRIESLPGLRIGIGWQGSPTFNGDVWRSIPLSAFSALANLDDVTLVSLQKHDGLNQIDQREHQIPLVCFDDLDQDGAFLDTLAVIQHLDLVVTSDTALAHLAGAAGVPVWCLVSTACDWRWMTKSNDTVWYDSMRLFRQQKLGQWEPVIAEVVDALPRSGIRR
ncbi:TPR repeat-containing protein [Rhodopirellula maiorica SM1]|uniref:TPR repeat-containing protein n=1 Tax=Rhodopirellula maiorica SM1 TaxID=1265738 RepID=M5S3J4_9BACT|nr:tetratricopeptide repeat protein [Rhodopirellula maiorica]EMI20749.1 TPR repeat-containing protein [Rhodopirellula maiorica SM1]